MTTAAAPTSTTPTGDQAAAPVTQDPKPAAPTAKPAEGQKPQEQAPKTESDLLTGDDATAKATEKPGSETKVEEIEFKVPEGVEVDKSMLDGFKPIAKELGLDSAKAQKLVDFYSKGITEANQRVESAWNEQKQTWRNEAAQDKEIGGAKFNENVQIARSAIDKFGGPGLKKALNDLGIGNHPEIIRFALRVGKAISEDSIAGARPAPAPKDDKDAMLRKAFPSMFPKDTE